MSQCPAIFAGHAGRNGDSSKVVQHEMLTMMYAILGVLLYTGSLPKNDMKPSKNGYSWKNTETVNESGINSNATFATEDKLLSHFEKHGNEFKGIYNSADEYLQEAKDVMNNRYKVEYFYKG